MTHAKICCDATDASSPEIHDDNNIDYRTRQLLVVNMPGRSSNHKGTAQRRRALISTTPNLQQRYFPSSNKEIYRKVTPLSVQSRRQQTITQMDPFHAIFHPEFDQENLELEYENEPESMYTEPKRGSKRRRLSGDGISMRVTRSATKAIAPRKSQFKEDVENRPTNRPPAPPASPSKAMPPPKTPTKPIRREIPSSQTPPDTPLSALSRHSKQDQHISPLKSRSINIPIHSSPSNTPKRVRWAMTRVVPDSMESEGLSRITSKSSNESLKTDRLSIKSPSSSQPTAKDSNDLAHGEIPESGDQDADQDAEQQSVPLQSESVVQVPSSPATQRIKPITLPYSQQEREADVEIDGSPVPTPPGSPPINANPFRIEYPTDDEDDASNQLLREFHHATLPPAPTSRLQESQYRPQWDNEVPPSSSLNSVQLPQVQEQQEEEE